MKKGFPALSLSLPKWCNFIWVRIFKSGIKAIQKRHSVHITVINNGKVSSPVIWDSLSCDFRLIISFRWDGLAVLNAWRQNLHPCSEKMRTDTVDKSTWSTLESPAHQCQNKEETCKWLFITFEDWSCFFFFFFACRAPNEQDKWQMHYEDSKVQLSTDLYWWPLNGEMRTVRASLVSLPETIVLVAVLLHSRIKKEKSPQVRCLLWGWALGLVLNSAATAE